MTHQEIEQLLALDSVGAATPEERRQIEAHISTCGPCGDLRREYEQAAALLPLGLDPVTPPAHLRETILETVAQDNVISIEQPGTLTRSRGFWWLATAATFFLALFGWNELRLRAARESLAAMEAREHELVEKNRRLAQSNQILSSEVSSLTSAATRTISLTGQEIAPASSARVFLDEKNRRALVFFYNLPQNPGDKSYQLWIIRADRPNPQSVGVFDAKEGGNARIVIDDLPLDAEMKALAVTLEPRGGMPAPTGKMVMLGNS